jgi:acyl-CoA reductase-like NAD-dependent aldehyde dehydrogenase
MPRFSGIPTRRRTMPKKIDPESIPAAVKIRRAAKASRSMTVRERLQVMLKAGLLTREQAERAAETEAAGKPE